MTTTWTRWRLKRAQRRLRKTRSALYYELGASLRERVPLVTAIRKYETRARTRGSSESLAYLEILRGLQNGSMSAAMANIATPLEMTLLDATQTAGDDSMAEGLAFMAQTVEKVDKMRASVIKAVAYPGFLLGIFSFMLTMFSVFAVPVLAELVPPEKWPPAGQILYATSNLVMDHGLTVLAALFSIATAFLYSLSRWWGEWRSKMDAFFPYNIYRDFSGALLLVSLAAMMNSGISLRSSLQRTQNHASPWMKWHVRRILLNLSRPNTPYFGQAFQTGVLNQEMADQVQDASERRDPVESFIRIGSRSIDMMVVILDRRAKVINMTMLLVCGCLLGMLFAGFITTAMSMQSGMQSV